MEGNGSIVKTSCAVCGELDLPARLVALTIYKNCPSMNFFRFVCPRCEDVIVKGIDEEGTKLLLHAECEHDHSVVVIRILIPLEVLEEHYCGIAMTEDDILDFTLACQGDLTVESFMQVG